MPPKDYDPLSQGTLFFSADGGETYELVGEISDVDIATDCKDKDETSLVFQSPQEMTFTATMLINKNMIWMLFGGTKDIPNNWLKMHGFPMRRKCRRRRC